MKIRRSRVILTAFVGGLISIAVWGKLRFVSNAPKTAYADPERDQRSLGGDQAPETGVDVHSAATEDGS